MTTSFATGIFDQLHRGHVAFLQQAAQYGDLIVALGSDRTLTELRGRPPVNTEQERLFMVQAVGCVHRAFISCGAGYLDFVDDLTGIRPDYFVVNEDGNTPDKRALCESLGIAYVVLKRDDPAPHSPAAPGALHPMPYRIDLAGGWHDQPFVSSVCPGSVITLSIQPSMEFNERSGMATSTRRTALEVWGPRLPAGDSAKLARILFCCDNPPGKTPISGAQDTVGIVYPGLARSDYRGEYWPYHIEHQTDEQLLRFVEDLIYLIPLGPRRDGYDVLSGTRIDLPFLCNRRWT